MMNSSAYLTLRDDASQAIVEGRLLDALFALNGQLSYAGAWSLKQRCAEIQQDYERLLAYYKMGADDPTRSQQYLALMRRAYELSEHIHRDYTLAHSSTHYVGTWQNLERDEDTDLLDFIARLSTDYVHAFDLAWTGPMWTADHEEQSLLYLLRDNLSLDARCSLLSGALVALLQSFDPHRFMLMVRVVELQLESPFYDRALLSLVLTTVMHQQVTEFYPHCIERVEALASQPEVVEQIADLQRMLLAAPMAKARDDEAFEAKLTKLLDGIKAVGDESDIVTTIEEERERANQREAHEQLQNHLRQYVQFHLLGVDVGYFAFSTLSRKLSFFNTTAHWLLPFDYNRDRVQQAISRFSSIRILFEAKTCDTDRNALLVYLEQLERAADPKSLKRAAATLSMSQPPPVQINRVDQEGNPIEEQPSTLLGVVHDLFRFCHLFRYRNDYVNPFRRQLVLLDHPLWRNLLNSPEHFQAMAEFCCEIKEYNLALQYLERLPRSHRQIHMMAECHIQLEQSEQAIESILQLLDYEPDSPELLRRLAILYKHVDRYEDMLAVLLRCEQLLPDDSDIALHIGYGYRKLGLYEEALPYIHKVIYLDEHNLSARRLLTSALLRLGRCDEARHHVEMVLTTAEVSADDYLFAGHCEWLCGDVTAACAYYVECVKANGEAFAHRHFFDEARELLVANGLTDHDLRYMLDLINTSL